MRPYTLSLFLLFTNHLMAQPNVLQKLLSENEALFGDVLQRPDQYALQIIYTQIDRDEHNRPHFTSHSYRLDENQYYYPASTVKMPIAFLALEKLNKLRIAGLDKHSAMMHGAASPPQTTALTDTSSATGLPSVAHYVRKVFLVSDNDASNRLYEFLGQAYTNETLRAKGYKNVSITHRLGISGFDEEANSRTNPVSFYDDKFNLLYHQGEVRSKADRRPGLKGTLLGKGFYEADKLVEKPFDFSKKNHVSLQDHHDMLKAVIFPEAVPEHQRFDLTADDYRFLYRAMSERPKESTHPQYDKPDHYVKFFIYGDRQDEERMPPNVRIFNKVGWAYGFLTDVAYIVDFEAGVEFFLCATILVNEDGVFNDDQYEYESIGMPFLSKLGGIIYEHEKQRPRKYRADLRGLGN